VIEPSQGMLSDLDEQLCTEYTDVKRANFVFALGVGAGDIKEDAA